MVTIDKVGNEYHLSIGDDNAKLVIDRSDRKQILAEFRKIKVFEEGLGHGTKLVQTAVKIAQKENAERIWGQIGAMPQKDEEKVRHILAKVGFNIDEDGYFFMNL